MGRLGAFAAGVVLLASLASCAPPTDRPGALVLVRARADGGTDLAVARLATGAVEVFDTPGRNESWPFASPVVDSLILFEAGPRSRVRRRLWLWEVDTGRRSLLTGLERMEHWAAWSPDGEQFAFVFEQRRRGGVNLVEIETGKQETLVSFPGPHGARFLRPSFAPDKRLLVAERANGSEVDLYLLAPGRPPEPLVEDPAWNASKPVFLPDGRTVVFARLPRHGEGKSELMAVEVGERRVRRLATDPTADDRSPAVCAKTGEIAFVRERDGRSDIWRLDEAGSPHRWTETPSLDEYSPRWSPDCSLMVVTTSEPDRPEEWVRVIDRRGAVRFETPGTKPDWLALPD